MPPKSTKRKKNEESAVTDPPAKRGRKKKELVKENEGEPVPANKRGRKKKELVKENEGEPVPANKRGRKKKNEPATPSTSTVKKRIEPESTTPSTSTVKRTGPNINNLLDDEDDNYSDILNQNPGFISTKSDQTVIKSGQKANILAKIGQIERENPANPSTSVNDHLNKDDQLATKIYQTGDTKGDGQTSINDLSDDDDNSGPFFLNYKDLDNNSDNVRRRESMPQSSSSIASSPGTQKSLNNMLGSFNNSSFRSNNASGSFNTPRLPNNTFGSNNASGSFNTPRLSNNTFGSNNASGSFNTPRLSNNTFGSNNAFEFESFDNDFRPRNSLAPASAPTLPRPFHDMDTIYQLCSWLCANPNVLQFAYTMYQSMQTQVNGSFYVSSTLLTVLQAQNQDNTNIGRDFLEELKCLFLRFRNPPKNAIEDLVRKIIKCDLNSAEGINWLRLANRHFGDFRNKFIDGIVGLIRSFKKQLSNERQPQKEEINVFIDEAITMNVLQRWLNATKIDELRAQNSLPVLRQFVQKAFLVNYMDRDTERTKLLDKITQNIAVPSRNGKNFATDLQL